MIPTDLSNLPKDPAFPFSYPEGNGDLRVHTGLTVREYCAIKILAGMNAPLTPTNTPQLCKAAIDLTDELFRQLNKKEEVYSQNEKES